MKITISTSKLIDTDDWIALMAAVGFGQASAYCSEKVRQSIAAYPFIAHADTENRQLIGYVSAFSDHAFSTFIGELVVHPSFQGQGIGQQLLAAVEAYSAGVPIYVNPLKDSAPFFIQQGFTSSTEKVPSLFKSNDKTVG